MIENKNLSEAVLESIIGQHGVSPEAKQSLATRVSELLNKEKLESNSAILGVANEKTTHVVHELVRDQPDVKA